MTGATVSTRVRVTMTDLYATVFALETGRAYTSEIVDQVQAGAVVLASVL